MKSIVEQRGIVSFPQFTGERIYMRPFFQADGLPFDLQRWQPTVDQMLDGVKTDQPIYLMVDQGLVHANTTHRREGLHIDGYWVPSLQAHGGHSTSNGGGDHTFDIEGRHRTVIVETPPQRKKKKENIVDLMTSGKHGHIHRADEWPAEAIILASTITAAQAYVGEWDSDIGEGGDCSHVPIDSMQRVLMEAGHVWAGNVTMLHESLPLHTDCLRTVVRLNVPGWSPN